MMCDVQSSISVMRCAHLGFCLCGDIDGDDVPLPAYSGPCPNPKPLDLGDPLKFEGGGEVRAGSTSMGVDDILW